MDEEDVQSKKAKTAAFKRNGGIIMLIVLFIAALTVASAFIPAKTVNPVNIGFVSEPCTYCVYGLSLNNDSHFSVTAYSGYEDMISALDGGTLDAALMPARYLDEEDSGKNTVVAITSLLNLTVVENGDSVYSIADLNERRIVLPESLKDSLEQRMLSTMLANADVSADILFADDEAIKQMAQNKDIDIMALPADQCAAVLAENENLRDCFSLADQWTSLMGSRPPADCSLVVRNEIIADRTDDMPAVLSAFKTSVDYLKSKHKKAAILVASGDSSTDYNVIRETIPHCQFEYLDGDAMAESLQELQVLKQQINAS